MKLRTFGPGICKVTGVAWFHPHQHARQLVLTCDGVAVATLTESPGTTKLVVSTVLNLLGGEVLELEAYR